MNVLDLLILRLERDARIDRPRMRQTMALLMRRPLSTRQHARVLRALMAADEADAR